MESEIMIDNEVLKTLAEHCYENKQLRNREFIALRDKCKRIHAAYLFYRDNISSDPIPQLCSEVYVMLVRRIGATRLEGQTPGWKDLGYRLGLLTEQINYIDNSVKSCPTDMVFKVLKQQDDATFGKVIDALLSLERFDVVEGIFEPLNKLTDDLTDKYRNAQDQGYYSNSSKERETEIIRPRCVIYDDVPEVLRLHRKQPGSTLIVDEDPPHEDNYMKQDLLKINDLTIGPTVMLTYSEDGISIAQNISNKIQHFDNGNLKIKVICLENVKTTVLANPEQYIRNYYEQADYVIPIITEKYIEVIKSPTNAFGSTMENIDSKYVRFIYSLMSSQYIHGTGCLNIKIRPILPQNINKKILNQLYMYPILNIWTWENELKNLLTALF